MFPVGYGRVQGEEIGKPCSAVWDRAGLRCSSVCLYETVTGRQECKGYEIKVQ